LTLQINKFSILLLLLATISTPVYSDEKNENCSFASSNYTIGSIIDMSGEKRICRNGMYERMIFQETNKLKYVSTDSFSKIQWRPLIPKTTKKNKSKK